MEDEPKVKKEEQATGPATGWMGAIEEQYRKIKENAETYPYVWGSYIVVYGGFALWTTYRWIKLRKTEDRVRALQARLRQLVEAEESASTAASVEKKPLPSAPGKQPPSSASPADKTPN
ncbi:hypothetical protein RJ641_011085 [Dillenia turbinata]|uniref:Transmembrane protein n=1 Tax=Dillenia turbinata TaxID=194707 RepID=A0AAN8V3R4_9MAGN